MTSIYEKTAKMKSKFLLVAGLYSLVLVSLSWFIVNVDVTKAITIGFLMGLTDNYVMFLGIETNSKKEPKKAFSGMKKNMLKRVLYVAIFSVLAIKAGLIMLWFLMAFLSIHVVCLVFVILYAKGIP